MKKQTPLCQQSNGLIKQQEIQVYQQIQGHSTDFPLNQSSNSKKKKQFHVSESLETQILSQNSEDFHQNLRKSPFFVG
jgi:hypothetical protein